MSWKGAIGTDVFDLDVMMNNIVFPTYYPPYNYTSTTSNPSMYYLSGPAGYQVDCSRWIAMVPQALQNVAYSIINEATSKSQGYNGSYGGGIGGYYGYSGPPFDINIFWGKCSSNHRYSDQKWRLKRACW